MIYTITFNPSLDYIVFMDKFIVSEINRTKKEVINPGGKGINVSIVLDNLGYDSTALGFMAGYTGKEIERLLSDKKHIETNFVELNEGLSRINMKIRAEEETAINGMGPKISAAAIKRLYNQIDHIQKGDFLILAGSIPVDLSETIYSDIMKHLEGKGINIVVDATGKLLANVLKYHPFMVKPNNFELGEVYGVEIKTKEDAEFYARKMHEDGARNVLVSLGGDGALLLTEDDEVYYSKPPKGEVINTVGAGDSMVAGFLAGYMEHNNYEEAFKMGLCTGSASSFSEGMATKEKVDKLLNQL